MSDVPQQPKQQPTKRQRFNQRPGRQAIVRIPVDGLPTPVEVTIVRIDQRSGTVELEIPVTATIGHRTTTNAHQA
jgi:hypothetical protein